MAQVSLHTPSNYNGLIANTPSGNAYFVSPGQIIAADQLDEVFLREIGFALSGTAIGGTSGISEAPTDGGVYGRSSSSWEALVPSGDVATTVYVDDQDQQLQQAIASVSQNLIFIGQCHVPEDNTTFTGASGIPAGALPVAGSAYLGYYVIVVEAGSPPVGSNIPAGNYAKADWIVCDGTSWSQLELGRTAVTAPEVAVIPSIAGHTDVQAALEYLQATDVFGSSLIPLMDGVGTIGVSNDWARADHIHPTDTSLYPSSNPSGFVDAPAAAMAAPVKSVATRVGAIVLTHADITDWTTTLAAYYPTTNPAGYQTAPQVATALAPYALTSSVPLASSTPPVMDGAAAVGTGNAWARSDHVHPVDTSRYAANNPSGFQTAAQVTAVLPVASTAPPYMDGPANAGTTTLWSKGDHVHPTDTSRAPVMGVTDGSNATAGQIGEYIVSANQAGSPLTSAIALTIASINLTPGCYEAWGLVDYSLDASKAPSMVAAAISGVNNALPTDVAIYTGIGNMTMLNLTGLTAGARQVLMTGQCRVNTSVAITLYVVANAVWAGGGTLTTKGYICARRVR